MPALCSVWTGVLQRLSPRLLQGTLFVCTCTCMCMCGAYLHFVLTHLSLPFPCVRTEKTWFSFQSCIGNSRMVQLECPDNDCHAVLPDVYLKEILPKDFLSRCVLVLYSTDPGFLKKRGRSVHRWIGVCVNTEGVAAILKREGGRWQTYKSTVIPQQKAGLEFPTRQPQCYRRAKRATL